MATEVLTEAQTEVLLKVISSLHYSAFYELTGMGAQKHNVMANAAKVLKLQGKLRR